MGDRPKTRHVHRQRITPPPQAPRGAGGWARGGLRRLSDVLHRNIPESPGSYLVTMTREGWVRE